MVDVEIKLNQEQIDHINTILYTTPEKSRQVFERAIRRGLDAGRPQAATEIKKRYDITTGNLRTYENVRTSIFEGSNEVVGQISFAGKKIPLYRFHPSPATRQYTDRFVNGVSGWRITKAVSAADNLGQMVPRPNAFIATFRSGHTGIFEREAGKKSASGKDKIREFFGYSVADMLDYEPAREEIQKKAEQTIEKRLDHELLRVLNGY
jgi:hypothetical protein